MSYFVTGTDTGVGKTLISCALLHAFAAQGLRVAGMKPVAAGGMLQSNGGCRGLPLAGAAGCDAGGGNEDVRQLLAASTIAVTYGQINPYAFPSPIAPHLAAREAGVRIDLGRIHAAFGELSAQADLVVVEGVGGFKVPLNEQQDADELAALLGVPVILVVGMRLGCLNHALLTVAAVEARGLKLAGWVANSPDAAMPALRDNIVTLERRIAAPLLGVIDYQATPAPRVVAGQLDIGLLKREEDCG